MWWENFSNFLKCIFVLSAVTFWLFWLFGTGANVWQRDKNWAEPSSPQLPDTQISRLHAPLSNPDLSHLCQPLLALSVSRGNQRLLGLVNEKRRALHNVTGRVQHTSCSLGVCGGSSDTTGCLGQSFQGLSCLSGCYSYTQGDRLQMWQTASTVWQDYSTMRLIFTPQGGLFIELFEVLYEVFSPSWQKCNLPKTMFGSQACDILLTTLHL